MDTDEVFYEFDVLPEDLCSIRPNPRRGVYALRGGDFVKIGLAADVVMRRFNVQTGCPFDLRPLGYMPADTAKDARTIERRLHRELRAHHVRGEWYRATRELLEHLEIWLRPWP